LSVSTVTARLFLFLTESRAGTVIRYTTISHKSISSAAAVAAFVALFYAVFTIVALMTYDWEPLWFVWIGERYLANIKKGKSAGQEDLLKAAEEGCRLFIARSRDARVGRRQR
jgi:hypothetical protein